MEKNTNTNNDRYTSLKLNISTLSEFEKFRAEISAERQIIMTKVKFLDFLLEEAKNNRK